MSIIESLKNQANIANDYNDRNLARLCMTAADKIEGLEADLTDAVETAFRRGAVEWTKSNHPKQYEMLNSSKEDQG